MQSSFAENLRACVDWPNGAEARCIGCLDGSVEGRSVNHRWGSPGIHCSGLRWRLSKLAYARRPVGHASGNIRIGAFKSFPRVSVRVGNIELTDFSEPKHLSAGQRILLFKLILVRLLHDENQFSFLAHPACQLLAAMSR